MLLVALEQEKVPEKEKNRKKGQINKKNGNTEE